MKNLKIKFLTLGILATVVMSSTPVFAATNISTSSTASTNVSVPTIPGTVKTAANICDPSFIYAQGYYPDGLFYFSNYNGDLPYLETGCYDYSGCTYGYVKVIQELLSSISLLPSSGIDGSFGPATQNAIIQFQKRAGLTPDGIVGPSTFYQLQYNRFSYFTERQ
jgi:hypothetical protein